MHQPLVTRGLKLPRDEGDFSLQSMNRSTSARVVEGIYAAGVDVGGVASGGYSSGLAQALVLGLVAAEHIAGC